MRVAILAHSNSFQLVSSAQPQRAYHNTVFIISDTSMTPQCLLCACRRAFVCVYALGDYRKRQDEHENTITALRAVDLLSYAMLYYPILSYTILYYPILSYILAHSSSLQLTSAGFSSLQRHLAHSITFWLILARSNSCSFTVILCEFQLSF